MCCGLPNLFRMCVNGVWGMFCVNCHTFTPE